MFLVYTVKFFSVQNQLLSTIKFVQTSDVYIELKDSYISFLFNSKY